MLRVSRFDYVHSIDKLPSCLVKRLSRIFEGLFARAKSTIVISRFSGEVSTNGFMEYVFVE
jgi:hypothetical protein